MNEEEQLAVFQDLIRDVDARYLLEQQIVNLLLTRHLIREDRAEAYANTMLTALSVATI